MIFYSFSFVNLIALCKELNLSNNKELTFALSLIIKQSSTYLTYLQREIKSGRILYSKKPINMLANICPNGEPMSIPPI